MRKSAGKSKAGKSGASSKPRKGLLDHFLPSWQSYSDILTADHDGLSENCSQYVESNVKWGKGKGSAKHTSGKAKSKGSSSSSSSSKTSNSGKGGSGKGDSEFAVDDNDDYNDDDDDDHYGKGGAKRPKSTRVPSLPSPTSAPLISDSPSLATTKYASLIPSIRPTYSPSAANPGDTPSANPSSLPRNLSPSLMPLDRPSSSSPTTTRPFALPSRFPTTILPSLIAMPVPTALPGAIPSLAPTVQTVDLPEYPPHWARLRSLRKKERTANYPASHQGLCHHYRRNNRW
jgi:hypothetical protein